MVSHYHLSGGTRGIPLPFLLKKWGYRWDTTTKKVGGMVGYHLKNGGGPLIYRYTTTFLEVGKNG